MEWGGKSKEFKLFKKNWSGQHGSDSTIEMFLKRLASNNWKKFYRSVKFIQIHSQKICEKSAHIKRLEYRFGRGEKDYDLFIRLCECENHMLAKYFQQWWWHYRGTFHMLSKLIV